MNKQMSQPTRIGQMAGAQIRIVEVHNDSLNEHVALVNRGILAQPLEGWALATLRGERIFLFPDGVILEPGRMVTVHSGEDTSDRQPQNLRLVWTREQVWNNRRDVAVLFDANGDEVDRYAYPPENRFPQRRKRLVRNGGAWRIVDEPKPIKQAHPRRNKRAPRA